MLVQKEIVMLQNSGGRMESKRAKESQNNSSSAGIALILYYANATSITDSQGISEKE
jgi:hypothetical protein